MLGVKVPANTLQKHELIFTCFLFWCYRRLEEDDVKEFVCVCGGCLTLMKISASTKDRTLYVWFPPILLPLSS
jgi:hypothetical protein